MCFIWFGNGERRKGEQTMSKGLEALKELKERLCFGYYVGEQVDTIEKELKAYYELESMHEELAKAYNKLCQEKIEWLKQKKALEIIKEKNFDLFYLQDSKDLEMYNDACDHFRNLCYLTQEEYNLLKEVLL